jgi:hypothetical protein
MVVYFSSVGAPPPFVAAIIYPDCTTCLLLHQQEHRREIEASLTANRIMESVGCRRVIIQLLRVEKFQ